jgi:hypothetical protein
VIRRSVRPTIVIGLAVVVVWLALPAVALADNCADWSVGEVQTCPAYAIDRIAAFLAFAAAAVGGLLASSPVAGAFYPHGRTREIKPGDWIPVAGRRYDGDEPWTPTQDEWDQMARDNTPTMGAGGVRG